MFETKKVLSFVAGSILQNMASIRAVDYLCMFLTGFVNSMPIVHVLYNSCLVFGPVCLLLLHVLLCCIKWQDGFVMDSDQAR